MSTDLFELCHAQREELDQLLIILHRLYSSNFSKALQCHITKHRHIQELEIVINILIRVKSSLKNTVAYGLFLLKEWNMLQIFSYHFISICFFEVINILI